MQTYRNTLKNCLPTIRRKVTTRKKKKFPNDQDKTNKIKQKISIQIDQYVKNTA